MKNKKISKIIYSSGLVLLSLVSCISATFSWFNTRRTVSAQLSGFEVSLPPSQTADLYYLAKNKNENLKVFSGYERSSLSEEDYTNFIKVSESDSSDASPTNTQLLWPNHELTFALVFTPIQTGAFTFSLDSWESNPSTTKKLGNGTGISLAWAINIYCRNVEHKPNFAEAKDNYFKEDLKDFFAKGENVQNPLSEIKVTDTSKEIAVYFTIRYSNDPSTYYEKISDENGNEYYTQNDKSSEQSNCYEGLTFKVNKFSLKLPGGEQ